MTVKFNRHEIPIVYSMITAARRIRDSRDGSHHSYKFFLLWTAFNSIYTTIAQRKGFSPQLILLDDGTVDTHPNGSVKIPTVKTVGDRELMFLALEVFDDQLKHNLIQHQSTQFFVNRFPAWQGKKIEHDAFGQRLNGVINLNFTSSEDYPVWSPIDNQLYEGYLENPDNEEDRDFLARQIVDLLYTVRCNLMFGGRKFDDGNDIMVYENSLPLVELIVSSFTQ